MPVLPLIDIKQTALPGDKKYQKIASEPTARTNSDKYRLPFSIRNSQANNKHTLSYTIEQEKPHQAIIKQKVWLIRKIGELICQDTHRIDLKRKKIKRNVDSKYKLFKRQADKLMNMINEEGNQVDVNDARKLRQTLK